jgi:predicted porin
MKHRKTQLAAAVGAALLVGGTAVQAQTVAPAQPVTVQLYGQVNRALMHADDESNSKWFFVDGQSSSTRFGILGRAEVSPGLRAGAQIETEIRSNRSNDVNFASPSNASQSFTERWLDVFFEGAWGKINLGQGSGAADGAAEVNLHGVAVALSNPMNDFGGNITFTTPAGASSGISVDAVASNFDFESRNDRLMYTTPTFGGFRLQAGVGQVHPGSAPTGGLAVPGGEAKEASLWYAGKLAGDLQAALGWSSVNIGGVGGDRETIGGSVAWLHSSGFNVAGTYQTRELGIVARDAKYWSAAVGYKFGQHALALKYEVTEDMLAASDEHTGIGIGYVWNPIRWAEIYAGYMIFELDRPGNPLNDITVAVLGSRIRF